MAFVPRMSCLNTLMGPLKNGTFSNLEVFCDSKYSRIISPSGFLTAIAFLSGPIIINPSIKACPPIVVFLIS